MLYIEYGMLLIVKIECEMFSVWIIGEMCIKFWLVGM